MPRRRPEPNDAEDTPVELGDQHCKASANVVPGVLHGDTDVDWFRYSGVFSGNDCDADDPAPMAAITVTADEPLEVCMFADCDIEGATLFDCPDNTVEANSPGGRKGCCGVGSMAYVVDCQAGADESAAVFVRLQMSTAGVCNAYSFTYSYQN
ncbi:hypothetical protein [Nannocystis sp. SCPEA4]|uniref:hypothetical protein n=1 Tax=Nannocystis sp. SCPEA4 TaxID=2996787 RepID=UPI00226DAC91|nr:hypothetical protein [Nannocystis sp. SCPEA4]MCY1059609.1 hypothetical protein [Nannocystis sp. SCPEA4]